MFRFLGWILAGAARVLDLTSTTIDTVLESVIATSEPQGSRTVVHSDSHSPSHGDGSGRVISQETKACPAVTSRSAKRQHGSLAASLEHFHSHGSLSDGYNVQAEQLARGEFKRLGSRVYVDHAGATLYSEKQLELAYQVSCNRNPLQSPMFTRAPLLAMI